MHKKADFENLISVFLKVYSLLSVPMRKRFYFLLIAILILAFVETAVLGLIAFYAASVSDPRASIQTPEVIALQNILLLKPFLHNPTTMIASLSVLVMLALPLKNVFRGWVTYRIACYSATLEAVFGQGLLTEVLAKDYTWHVQQNSADLVQTVNWRHQLGRNFVRPYLDVVCETSMLLVLLIGLLWVQPVVSLIFIAMQGGAGVLVYRVLRHGLDKSATGCRQSEMAMNRHITRSIHGVKDVKLTNTSGYFIKGFEHQAQKFSSLFGSQQFWRESPLLALETLGFILIACAILFMLFVMKFSPLETTGTTALLAVTAWRTLPAFNRIVSSLAGIRTSRPYVLSMLEMLQSIPPSESFHDARNSINFQNEIKMENVCFAYDSNQPVLHNLCLTIHKGQSLGVMGPSGCGKSTLVDVLVGLLVPQQGHVLIDGVPLSSDMMPAWRQKIGYVPQFPYIFEGTLAENVAFGLDPADIVESKVLQMCELAAVDFLQKLPQGIHTSIGERGIHLSGGQRQRVAIARALYRQPELIIFDEATSALDEENDQQIRKLILNLKGQQTLVVISHRTSTVEGCDVVFRLFEENN
jgi:ABC-type multidrug transport system fused ATPase/permease subunit